MLSSKIIRAVSKNSLVLSSFHRNVCKVKLNKPKALNSLCIQMIDEMQEALAE